MIDVLTLFSSLLTLYLLFLMYQKLKEYWVILNKKLDDVEQAYNQFRNSKSWAKYVLPERQQSTTKNNGNH